MDRRPSNKEIINKVRDALEAIKAGRRSFGVTKHLSSDLAALEIDCEEQFWKMLPQLFQEIITSGPLGCYRGGRPPSLSYDDEMKGMELWPYAWKSDHLHKTMWIKFSLKKDRQLKWQYIHVDIHEDRPEEDVRYDLLKV